LAKDIRVRGLRVPIVTWSPKGGGEPPILLDGRSRLDALARAGLLYEIGGHIGLKAWLDGKGWLQQSGGQMKFQHLQGGDPYDLAISFNVHRRHLTSEQKRELVAKLLKLQPEISNRRIADQVKVISPPTVAKVRKELEQKGDVKKFSTSIDTKGRKQPAKKPKAIAKTAPSMRKTAAGSSGRRQNPDHRGRRRRRDQRRATQGRVRGFG
jgi:hypothetical protein